MSGLGSCAQDGSELAGARVVERGTERVLGPRGDQHGTRAGVDLLRECLRDQPAVVDRHGDFRQAQRGQEVADRGIGGILDQHAIARAQVRVQHALDPVERAGDDGDRPGWHAIGFERGRREVEQLGVVGVQTADRQLAVEVDPGQRRANRGQQRLVGKAQAEIAAGGSPAVVFG